MSDGAFLLKSTIQTYPWGRVGSGSEVALLANGNDASFDIDENTTYAELWMGTHPRGANRIVPGDRLLSDWLKENPQYLGSKLRQRFGDTLPFLFKVLSVNKALSIQAHPNKAHAEILHAADPAHYPDDNHKPEVAIALTEFEGLCGFRPLHEIFSNIKAIPEIQNAIGAATYTRINESKELSDEQKLKSYFTAMMKCDQSVMETNVESLVKRVGLLDVNSSEYTRLQGELLCRVNGQFPGDVGCFSIYFLNHIVLKPGESMYLEATLPHAYLSGDCIECMACSDNVVRAGFTPKYKDVDTLCEMLNYSGKTASENRFKARPHPSDPYVTVYDPDIDDFTVSKIELPADVTDYSLPLIDGASIILVIEGEGRTIEPLSRGSVLFVSANQNVTIAKSNGQRMLMFRAYCQL
ncbi:mannose-6-phosphate isomerase-like [Tubulanus polymorphus]|uniref:mannose-6-phosphate isomerase-like n=1 Tax=Tubulanus polymorphus TaxID=672921 RepID=UPI003DA33803